MPDRDPTNGELLIMLNAIKEATAQSHGAMLTELGAIRQQVTITNGRVTRLERLKYMAIGAGMFLNLAIVPLLYEYLKRFAHFLLQGG